MSAGHFPCTVERPDAKKFPNEIAEILKNRARKIRIENLRKSFGKSVPPLRKTLRNSMQKLKISSRKKTKKFNNISAISLEHFFVSYGPAVQGKCLGDTYRQFAKTERPSSVPTFPQRPQTSEGGRGSPGKISTLA